MRWIVIFTNKPDSDDIRQAHLQAHLDYFKTCTQVTLAGSTTKPGAERSNGGVWIIKGVSHEEAVRICKEDPFFKAGLRASMDILAYTVAPQFEDAV